MIAVIAQQTLETDGAEAVLAEGLDFLGRVDLAPALLKLADLIVTHRPF
jgi:hypothetical protein